MFNKSNKDNQKVIKGFALQFKMDDKDTTWAIKSSSMNNAEIIGALNVILHNEMHKQNVKNEALV
jgi:hypothetical protein